MHGRICSNIYRNDPYDRLRVFHLQILLCSSFLYLCISVYVVTGSHYSEYCISLRHIIFAQHLPHWLDPLPYVTTINGAEMKINKAFIYRYWNEWNRISVNSRKQLTALRSTNQSGYTCCYEVFCGHIVWCWQQSFSSPKTLRKKE
jgi:hypothetical protein